MPIAAYTLRSIYIIQLNISNGTFLSKQLMAFSSWLFLQKTPSKMFNCVLKIDTFEDSRTLAFYKCYLNWKKSCFNLFLRYDLYRVYFRKKGATILKIKLSLTEKSEAPHGKNNQCLTNINQYLIDTFKIQPILMNVYLILKISFIKYILYWLNIG